MRNHLIALFVCLSVASCADRSLRTANLTHKEEYKLLIGDEIMLMTGDHSWLLFRDPYDPITDYSQGYVLSLLPTKRARAIAAGESPPPSTPNGLFQVISVADGGTILIEEVREYGMETAAPVAVGLITLADGRRFPFESEWWPDNNFQIVLPPGKLSE